MLALILQSMLTCVQDDVVFTPFGVYCTGWTAFPSPIRSRVAVVECRLVVGPQRRREIAGSFSLDE